MENWRFRDTIGILLLLGVTLFVAVPIRGLTQILVILLGVGIASLWIGNFLLNGCESAIALQLVKLVLIAGAVLPGIADHFFRFSPYYGMVGFILVPLIGLIIVAIVAYETITVPFRWHDSAVPTFRVSGSPWYVLLRGIEVAAVVAGLAVIFALNAFIESQPSGPVPAPAATGFAMIIVSAGFLVVGGAFIRSLGELCFYMSNRN